jgi:hypothetical protein
MQISSQVSLLFLANLTKIWGGEGYMYVYRLWNVQRVTFIISVTLRKVDGPVCTTNMDPGLFFWALMARHISTSEKGENL